EITNRAHALMFLGRDAEARALYLAHKGEPLNGKTWEQVIADDFGLLRKAGLANPLMAAVEADLHLSPTPETPPAPSKFEAKVEPPPAEKPAPSEPTPVPVFNLDPHPDTAPSPPPALRTPTAFNCAKA